MTSVSAGHIILTPTQPVGSRRPPHQKSHALPNELPRPPREERGGVREIERDKERGGIEQRVLEKLGEKERKVGREIHFFLEIMRERDTERKKELEIDI